ncbi:MAG: helix-turn-helix transcriptional regulator [Clostridia bacterium]|nr:helix-turn-helix transcriptional regulator [Clostridia bacterium]
MLMYMEKNFVSDITLRDVAKSLGYNYEYISREFNKILGISFKTMLNQYRCERARYLIETTDQSLTEVAEQSGFQSIRSFNRVFKQQLGILPSELKRDRLRSLPRVNKGIHRSGK